MDPDNKTSDRITIGEQIFVLLDDNLSSGMASRLFVNPIKILTCNRADDLDDTLAGIDQALDQGFFVAGYFAYELGYLLEPKLRSLLPEDQQSPLIWVGVFEAPEYLSAAGVESWIQAQGTGQYEIEDFTWSWSREAYGNAFQRVKDYIAAGDVYQINLTFKTEFQASGDPLRLYHELREKQKVHYGAYINTGDRQILSLSPELFLACEKGQIQARPMKGTARRGRTDEEDQNQIQWLQNDEKSRAENLMIVDLLRNDLGRAARIGSVRVTELFTIESYPTVHQMTSGITAQLRDDLALPDLLRCLFPCGSITGAPKVRAMEIIRELEPQPRGLYTGAIGYIAPTGTLAFNVAIRSLTIDRDGQGEMGIGSGVVYDSQARDEYDECLLKARFLTDLQETFSLIETLRWDGDFYLLSHHMDRLESSARYFGFPFNLAQTKQALLDHSAGLSETKTHRVRLLLCPDGTLVTSSSPIELSDGGILHFVISDRVCDSSDLFFRHKTTKREIYDSEFKHYRENHDCSEVLFINERGELTEGSRSSLFLELDGELVTPPLTAGILPGTFRREMMERAELGLEERVLYPQDLARASRIFFGNSVRGLQRAEQISLPRQSPVARALP
ncbi:MAG: aminodeoxychorismate synthase component I [Pseudomonadota bacterium]